MILPTLEIEQELWSKGFNLVCGIDEVGRGCFAGPVVVGAVVFPKGIILPPNLADSKLLTPSKRESLSQIIKQICLYWGVAQIDVPIINKIGIGKSTQSAFRKVVKNLKVIPDFILIDAFSISHLNKNKQRAISQGDSICASISAASIIAKVYRDNLMREIHQIYPEYGFSKHKGYGTKEHQEAITKFGLSKIHRKSFNLDKFLKT